MPRKNLILIRQGVSSDWETVNPVLSSGEPGFDYSKNIFKIGDGVKTWNSLPIINSGSLINGGGVADHGMLLGLNDDDHIQYVHINNSRVINAIHIMNNGLISSGNITSTEASIGQILLSKMDGGFY